MCFDLFLVADELGYGDLKRKTLKLLLLNYPRSIQARHAFESFDEPDEFLKFVNRCVEDDEFSSEICRRLIPAMEYASKKWGHYLWSELDRPLKVAIVCARELKATETRSALEKALAVPERWDLLQLHQKLADDNTSGAELITVLYDVGVTGSEELQLFLPELERRGRAEEAAEFFEKTWQAFVFYKERQFQESSAIVEDLREKYNSRRLEWNHIFTLANRLETDAAREASESLTESDPQSVWSITARELVATFEKSDEILNEQATLLAATSARYSNSAATQFRIVIDVPESISRAGTAVPAGRAVCQFDPGRGFTFDLKSADETIGLISADPDDSLTLYLPSFDGTRIFQHPYQASVPVLEMKLEFDPEQKESRFNFGAGIRSEDEGKPAAPVRFETSFAQDFTGFQDYLRFERSKGQHPTSLVDDLGTVEITWKTFAAFAPEPSRYIWRSQRDGSRPSLTVSDRWDANDDVSVCLSWGDEQNGVFQEIDFPDLPRQKLSFAVMLPIYAEAMLKWAHRAGYISSMNDRELASTIEVIKSVADRVQKERWEQFSEETQVLEPAESKQDRSPSSGKSSGEQDSSDDSLLDSLFPDTNRLSRKSSKSN